MHLKSQLIPLCKYFQAQLQKKIIYGTSFTIPRGSLLYRGDEKSLARPGREQARKHVRDARDFNNISFFSPLQGKAQKKIHAILTETLACFSPHTVTAQAWHKFNLIYLHNKMIGLPLGRLAPCAVGTDLLRYRISPNQEHTS